MKSAAQVIRILLAIVLLAIYPLNMAFYSGATIGDLEWRLEHGRLQLEYQEGQNPQSFYIAINSEHLRFAPEWNWWNSSAWSIHIPLWIPLAILILWIQWSRWRHKRKLNS